eukprot:scaffold2601_cov285-Chaetoceros_neogracile.AAC.5
MSDLYPCSILHYRTLHASTIAIVLHVVLCHVVAWYGTMEQCIHGDLCQSSINFTALSTSGTDLELLWCSDHELLLCGSTLGSVSLAAKAGFGEAVVVKTAAAADAQVVFRNERRLTDLLLLLLVDNADAELMIQIAARTVMMMDLKSSHIMNIRWVAACELDTTDRQIAMEVDRSTAKIIVPAKTSKNVLSVLG